MIIRILLSLLSLLLLNACALTAPDGVKELELDLKRDQESRALNRPEPLEGSPIFLKVRAYPQLRNGVIYGSQWILMPVGREKMDFEGLIRGLEGE